MQHPIGYYPAFTNRHTCYLRKRPYHSTRKIYKQLNKTSLRQDSCSKWALTLQRVSLAIAKCREQTVSLKKERLDELEAEEPEKIA